MPMKTLEFPYVVGVRLTAAEVEKLDTLAQKTCRPRGAVMRLLIEQASATSSPDIVLLGLAPTAIGAEGAADAPA